MVYCRRDGSIFGWRIFPEIEGYTRGPLTNIIDVEGKVKQEENKHIDNIIKSEKDDGDLVRHEDSNKHIGVQ